MWRQVYCVSGAVVILAFQKLAFCRPTFSNPGESATQFDYVLNFEDPWNYTRKVDTVPILNTAHSHLEIPTYSFSNDLRVEGLPKDYSTEGYSKSSSRAAKKARDDPFSSKMTCGVCILGVGLLHREVGSGSSFGEIKGKFINICVGFNIETLPVCSGIFDTYGPEILPVLNRTIMSVTEICSFLFECGNHPVPKHQWTIDLPEVKNARNRTPKKIKDGAPYFKVLHISDTHYDPDYAEGSVTNCAEPLCCRNYSTPAEGQPIVLAGKWGSFEVCDAPRVLIENMFRHIAEEHPDIDYVIWTGDLPPHDVWNQTKQKNLDIIRDTVDLVAEIFHGKPVFPAIGNHESSPAGNFPPPWIKHPSHSISWLYEDLASQWKKWLPDMTESSILHGAFYSVLLRPGFRLISLNTNYCHTLSWWLTLNSTDPANELKWLVSQLQQAEDNNEKVHIIGHIAPGSDDCLKVWSENFYRIVERYQDTIVGQFYGHMHSDEFQLFYETSQYRKPTNVAYLGPSVTPNDGYNPAYRIYYVDGDHSDTTREVLDHETWSMDLDQANAGAEPVWTKLYSAKEAYQMSSLRPSEWNWLVDQMVEDDEQFEQFHKYYYRDSSRRPLCNKKCKSKMLCALKSGKSMSKAQLCHELEAVLGM